MAKRMKDRLVSVALLCMATLVIYGCESLDALRDATAVQLETALISLMDMLVKTVVYNALEIPLGSLF